MRVCSYANVRHDGQFWVETLTKNQYPNSVYTIVIDCVSDVKLELERVVSWLQDLVVVATKGVPVRKSYNKSSSFEPRL